LVDARRIAARAILRSSAHFPKSALHRRNTSFADFGKLWALQMYESSAAFDLKSLNPILPRVSQGIQIGGTSHGYPFAKTAR